MFNSIFKEYELNVAKADAVFESAKSVFDINMLETSFLINNDIIKESAFDCGLYEKANENFMSKIKEFFKSLIKAFNDLAEKMTYKIMTEIKKKQINIKLKDIKKKLASDKIAQQAAKGKKVKWFDSVSYMKAYSKYINTWVSESRKLYSKVYKSADGYKTALEKFDKTMDECAKKLNLSNSEKYYIEANGLDALKMSDKEAENHAKSIEYIRKECERAMQSAESLASKTDDPSKVSDIQSRSKSVSGKSSSILKKISQSTIVKLGAVLGIASLLTYTSNYHKGKREGLENGKFDSKNDNFVSGLKSKLNDEYNKGYKDGFNNVH